MAETPKKKWSDDIDEDSNVSTPHHSLEVLPSSFPDPVPTPSLAPVSTPLAFNLSTYKTQKCQISGRHTDCLDYHKPKDRRRPPNEFAYYPTPCRYVKIDLEWQDPKQCPFGDRCQFSHTDAEVKYHQNVFRKNKCTKVKCHLGKRCSYLHENDSYEEIKREEPLPVNTDLKQPCDPQPIPSPVAPSDTSTRTTSEVSKETVELVTETESNPRDEITMDNFLERFTQQFKEESLVQMQLNEVKSRTKMLENEVQSLRANIMCAKCRVNERCKVAIMCGHVLCSDCTQIDKPCPVCETPCSFLTFQVNSLFT